MPSDTSRRLQLATKRLIDLLGSAAGLVVLSPVLAGAGLAVWASMGRPLLFSQQRPGYKGRLFKMNKFRTMHSPEEGEVWLFTDDKRLTPVGRFLRRTSLDELPELWNVLRGDMSLVGPRPLLAEYLVKYTPAQRRRHDVKPGITGWAQVNGRQTITFSERFEHDVWYVDHFGLGLDLKILLMTIRDVFRSRGVVPGQNVDDVDDLGFISEKPANTARLARR